MARSQFDSSQVYPLFQIISPNRKIDMTTADTKNESAEATSQKPKHRNPRPAETVHKSSKAQPSSEISIHKSDTRKHKSKYDEENVMSTKSKVSRKNLIKQNEQIAIENQKLVEQLGYLQQTMSRKVAKLKEKLISVQNANEEITQENQELRAHCKELLGNMEEYKVQLKGKQNCLQCEEIKKLAKKINTELGTTKIANKELNEDVDMLKNVVFRLNTQLERYQEKLRNKQNNPNTNPSLSASPPPNILERPHLGSGEAVPHVFEFNHEHDHPHIPISWGNVNTHTLGPLLDAYRDTIKEKEGIICDYEKELSNFTGRLKAVVDENEILHKKIGSEMMVLKKSHKELESTKEELRVTKEQNDLLIKKCSLKHDKLQEIIKVYDHKVSSIKLDYDVLQEQYHKSRSEYSNLQGKYQSLTDTHEAVKQDKQEFIPLSVHTASVNECKRLFEELRTQYDNEKGKLLNQLKFLEEQITDLGKQVVDLGTDKRDLQIKVKTTEKQLRKTENKLSETCSSLTHIQISRDACKRQLAKAIQFGKELVHEQESLVTQLSNKHKESKAVKQFESTVANRMDMLKTKLKAVQKDAYQELQTVELRIQEQDDSIETMRREHEAEVAKLLKDIQQKDDCIAKLVDQSEIMPTYLLYRHKNI